VGGLEGGYAGIRRREGDNENEGVPSRRSHDATMESGLGDEMGSVGRLQRGDSNSRDSKGQYKNKRMDFRRYGGVMQDGNRNPARDRTRTD
jgi:hypothetical protein